MREIEKFSCPNVDCGYVGITDGECPECGRMLARPKGDDNPYGNDIEDDTVAPMAVDFDDDPDAVTWYSDGEEKYGTM